MIVQTILNVIANIIGAAIGLLPPAVDMTSQLVSGVQGAAGMIGQALAIVDPIVPAASIGVGVTLLVSVASFGLILWMARLLLSLVSGGGGNV